MKDIWDEYGDFILQIIGGMACVFLFIEWISPNGFIHQAIANFINGAVSNDSETTTQTVDGFIQLFHI